MVSDKSPTTHLDGPYVHTCQHPGCTRWGSFGYDKGKWRTDWFCREHRPEVLAESAEPTTGTN
ncbi:hypothetical protein OIU34_38525 [Pararhizobium sp. BT-229]|nr:hypothetical protein [Pararhizobium sp. BT-229]MCV9967719.1 hypothetical protein [Pararhizobium sp. BT-229]